MTKVKYNISKSERIHFKLIIIKIERDHRFYRSICYTQKMETLSKENRFIENFKVKSKSDTVSNVTLKSRLVASVYAFVRSAT